jgi:predicted nicotinamide N-methyase
VTASETKTVHGLVVYKKTSSTLKKLLAENNEPEIHGTKVWFSSFFVIDYLDANPPEKKSRIMEIGCGWGLLSIYCAKKYEAIVTGVDADKHVFPFLDLHAKANNTKVKKKVARFENLSASTLKQQDLIVGADICFWKELIDPLYQVIKKTVEEGVPRIIIADPGRSPFLKLAKKCKKKFGAELIDVEIHKPTHKEGYLLIIDNSNE